MKLIVALLLALLPVTSIAGGFPAPENGLSDCEDRWFLKPTEDPKIQILGFAYIDPTVGLTIEHNGEAGLNENGEVVRLPNELRDKEKWLTRSLSR